MVYFLNGKTKPDGEKITTAGKFRIWVAIQQGENDFFQKMRMWKHLRSLALERNIRQGMMDRSFNPRVGWWPQ